MFIEDPFVMLKSAWLFLSKEHVCHVRNVTRHRFQSAGPRKARCRHVFSSRATSRMCLLLPEIFCTRAWHVGASPVQSMILGNYFSFRIWGCKILTLHPRPSLGEGDVFSEPSHRVPKLTFRFGNIAVGHCRAEGRTSRKLVPGA